MKGSILDLLTLIVFLTFMVFSSFLVFKIYSEMKTKMISEYGNSTNSTEVKILEKGETVGSIFINSIPFVVFGMALSSIALAFLIPTSRIFFPFAILLLVISGVLSFIFKEIIENFLSTQIMTNIVLKHGIITLLVSNLHLIFLVLGFVLIIVMYVKSEYEE